MTWEKMERLFLSVTLLIAVISLNGSFAYANKLDEIKAAIDKKGAKWIAGETSVAKLPDHEKKLRLGLIKHAATGNEDVLSLQETLAVLPPSLDWRANGGYFVTPVRDQGNCGSCWAFATTGALESYILIKDGRPGINEDRAEEILLSCPISPQAGSCAGGYISTASDYIRDTGLPPESDFPYTESSGDDSCGNASTGWRNYTSRIPAWLYVNTTSVSIDAIRNALNTHGPLVTTFDVYYDFYYYTGGIYKYTSGKYQGGHAVLIVGYRDDPLVDGGGYFIVKNSWGLDWGEDGYFNIAYSQIGSPVYFGEWTIAYKQPTQPSSPTAPNNLTVTAASSTQINIRWTDNATNEEAFKIERCTGHDCTDFSQIATVGANVTSYSNTGLAASTTYIYRVRAYNSVGDSTYSNTDYATTPEAPVPPLAPTNLAAVAAPKTRINLSWNDNSINESGFKIERCTGLSCTNFSQIATVGTGTTRYTNAGLRKGTSYTYRVKAYNTGGDSDYSNTAVAKATVRTSR